MWFFKLGERPHRQDHRRRAACRVRKRDRAVRCAVEVQRGMAERNAAISPEERIEFRVGINLGDVIVEGEDIFGDGVNIAARLEALAEPGGICVSRVIRCATSSMLPSRTWASSNLAAVFVWREERTISNPPAEAVFPPDRTRQHAADV